MVKTDTILRFGVWFIGLLLIIGCELGDKEFMARQSARIHCEENARDMNCEELLNCNSLCDSGSFTVQAKTACSVYLQNFIIAKCK